MMQVTEQMQMTEQMTQVTEDAAAAEGSDKDDDSMGGSGGFEDAGSGYNEY